MPGQGSRPTPFYDLMRTRLYAGLSAELAFAIGGEVRPGELGLEHLALKAGQLCMQPLFLAQQAKDMAEHVPAAVRQATGENVPLLTRAARTLAARLGRFVASTTRKLASRITTAR